MTQDQLKPCSSPLHLSALYPLLSLTHTPGSGGGGGLSYKSDVDAHRKVRIKPLMRPMWVWLELKLASKGDFCVVSVRALFVNFFMYSPKRYLNGQIWRLSIPDKIYNSHPKARRRASPSLLYGTLPLRAHTFY